jgi:WD40 repeat protein
VPGVSAFALAPDGQDLLVLGGTCPICRIDPSTGVVRGRSPRLPSVPLALAFSADDKALFVGEGDGALRTYDLATRRGVRRDTQHGAVTTIAMHGTTLASGGRDGNVRLWRADGTLVRQLSAGGPVGRVAWSADGALVYAHAAASESSRRLRAWDAKTAALRIDRLTTDAAPEDYGSELALALGAGGELTTGVGKAILRWPPGASTPTRELDGIGLVDDVAVAPGNVIALGVRSGRDDLHPQVFVRSRPSVEPSLWANAAAMGDVPVRIAISPDGHALLFAAGGKLGDGPLTEGAPTRELTGGETGLVSAIAYSSNGALAASASFDGSVTVWSVKTGRALFALRGYGDDGTIVTDAEGHIEVLGNGLDDVPTCAIDGHHAAFSSCAARCTAKDGG